MGVSTKCPDDGVVTTTLCCQRATGMEPHRTMVGSRIRALREQKGLTQAQLGELVGVREKTVSRWENGRHVIYTSNAKRLAVALDVDTYEILGEPPAPLGLDDSARLERVEAKLDALLEHFAITDPAEELEMLLEGEGQPSEGTGGDSEAGGPSHAAAGR